MIDVGSVEESTIADWMEGGLRFRYTTNMVIEYRKDVGMEIVGRNAVMNHFDRMSTILNKIVKSPQDNSKPCCVA